MSEHSRERLEYYQNCVRLGQYTPKQAAELYSKDTGEDENTAYCLYFYPLWPDYERATGGR